MRKIIIIFFILFLTFLCLEIILNVCYGIPSREDDPPGFKYLYVDIYEKFFEKVTKNYKSVYSPQRVQSVARDFPVVKAENTVRIFVVGASVVEIWGRCSDLQRALEEQVSNRNFEIINCGIGGYDSYRVYLVTKEIVLYEPDLIIVMSSGNNEYYDKTRFNAKAYYLNKFLRKSLVYRNVQDNILEWADEIGLKNLREKEKRLIDYGNN
ncbi:MAG: hypothetical protein KAJ14_04840, partial [Candidatus Omnitrophica bacterium]|nr:hypothetical protein [Candidatus Omnitrophota bacterium]